MYMDRAAPGEEPLPTPESRGLALGGIGLGRGAAIAVCVGAILAFGLDPGPILTVFQAGASHLLTLGV
jgi:hypothetical protein